MLNIRTTDDDDNVYPSTDMELVAAHRAITRLTIPTAEEIFPPFNTSEPPPVLAPRTTGQLFPSVFHRTSSGYMTTEFLKRCFVCKKNTGVMVDIFMYNDRSFCSDVCRNKQMDKDIVEEEMKFHDKMKNDKRSCKNPLPKGNEKSIFFIDDV
ncbi:hypothetical protein L2E82_02516 [Cichorium intybus]|uniref:Uncharacterized protein n=1 Tax=Cichorium intybus TaxID=13427 RepID=A0ACB9H1J7_CICIN|nr:hypothetical protein L2E82_02516 [Cichorium intybus]